MELTFLHIVIMLVTVMVVIGGGIYAARSVKSAEGYSLGGRNAGVTLVAGSIAGTVVGGGATVGTAQLAFTLGFSAWWFTLGSGIAFIIMGLFYAKPLRSTGLETIPQYLKRNYGNQAASMAGIVSSAGILFSAVASCLPGIQLIAAMLGVGVYPSAVLLVALVAAYIFFGGMKSTGVGGWLKMVVIWISLFAAGAAAFMALMELKDFDAVFFEGYRLSMMGKDVGVSMSSLASVIVGVLCTQTYIQCIFSASSPRVASLGCFAAAAIVIPVGLPSVAIGMYMFAAAPDVTPILVLPLYLVNYQPVWLAGMALGGIMLSLVGSIGGLSLGIGTMLTRDIISKLVKIPEKSYLKVTRLVVVGVMALASAIALVNLDSQVLFWNYMSMALRGAGVFLPFTIAVFSPRSISKKWAFCSVAAATFIPIIIELLGLSLMPPLFLGLIVSSVFLIIGYFRRWRPAGIAKKH